MILAGFLIFLLTGAVFVLSARNTYGQNGTLYFSPSSSQHLTGETFSVALRVNTNGAAINAAEGSAVFDEMKVNVVSISKSGSIFSLWTTEPIFSNAEGTIDFAGGLPSPGYSGSSGLVLTITFKAKTATTVRGYTDIVLVSGAILANDGEGTNILSSLGKHTVYIGPSGFYESPAPLPSPGQPSVSFAPVITSPTHPDQDKWYSNKNPVFKWELPSGVKEVKLVLSRRSSSAPLISYIPPISEKTLTDLEDGVWYFNGRFRTASGWDPITSFRFQIDTQAPDSFEITRVDTDDPTNPQPELLFESRDGTSGIDRYEMKIGEGDWFVIDKELEGKPYKLPLQAPGDHPVSVKAFDNAGNFTTATITAFAVEPIKEPVIKEVMPPKVRMGEPIIVKGEALPKVIIKLYARGDKGLKAQIDGVKTKIVTETPADQDGNWTAELKEGLSLGKYALYAYAQDERGALSLPSNEVVVEIIGEKIYSKVINLLMRGFDSLMNFIINGWVLIIAGVAVFALILAFIKKAIPFLTTEISRFVHIAREYKLSKDLRGQNKKLQFELRTLRTDLEKELDLLKKIKRHRGLSSSEEYFKAKIEKYLKLTKSLG